MADLSRPMLTSEDLPGVSDVLFAGDMKRVEKTIVIVTGQAALPRGTVMGKITASGKYAAFDAGASDGTEDPVGVLGEDTPAASADVTSYMFVTGQFNKAMLLDIDGVAVDAAALAALEAFNIYGDTVYG